MGRRSLLLIMSCATACALAVAPACGDIVIPDDDTAADTAPDATPDTGGDTSPDTVSDVVADLPPDAVSDAQPDVIPDTDVIADVADTSDTTDVGPELPQLLPCVDSALDPAFGDTLATAFTTAATDDFTGSCGTGTSKDVAWQWTVPFSEWFVLDTVGSDFDTVLYLVGQTCDGPEVACNNDANETTDRSRIVASFEQGDTYALVVDGNAGASGNAVVNIQPVTCPGADVGDGSGLPATFTTASGKTVHGGACGGDAGPERSYRFTPPTTGLWRLSATADVSAPFNTALYLEQGAVCGGEQLQCNTHTGGSIGMPTQVSRMLPGGEPVTVIVDSASGQGAFELNAEKLADTCPATLFDGFGEVSYDIEDQQDVMTTSCGENADVEFGSFNPYKDLLITVKANEPGWGGSCTLFIDAGFEFSVAAMKGECSGPELDCKLSTPKNNEAGGSATYQIPNVGGTLTLSISPIRPQWQGWSSTMVTIGIGCVI